MFDEPKVMFWPVGTGDSTSVVVQDGVVLQVDLRDLHSSNEADDDHAAIIDELVENLPKVDDMPYLSAFALTHPDKDHILGFEELLDRVTIGEIWFTPRVFIESDQDLCCQRRSKIRPLGRSKSRPVWRERLGACGPHIASPVQGALAVRPILWGSFVGGGEAGAALIEAVAFAVHLEDVDVVCQPVQQRAGQALGAEGFGPLLEGQVRRDQGRSSLVAL